MTAADVGDPLGFDRATISRIENGQRAVTLDEAVDIAGLLGISVAEMCSPEPLGLAIKAEIP